MTQTVHHYKGLSDNEVLESRKLHGINVLTQPEKETFWQKLLETFKHPISIVMFCLFALSVLTPFFLPIERIWAMTAVVAVSAVLIIMTGFFGGFNDPLFKILITAFIMSIGISIYEFVWAGKDMSVFFEPVGIIAALLLATSVAYFLEKNNEKTFQSLNEVNDETPVKVIRNNNTCQIPRKDVVVGDIVLLETGEEIPADCRLKESLNLTVNESTLTGELQCRKSADPLKADKEATYPSDCIMKGTTITEGYCTAEVISVGDKTEAGKVFKAAQVEQGDETPLSKKLDKLANLITKLSNIIAGLIVVGRVIMFFAGGNADFEAPEGWLNFITYLLETVMIAVTLIVVAVPEGLPMSVTLSLAFSMRKLMNENTLPRTMHSCETMGAVSVICTDKTGTLTKNQMQVADCKFLESDQQIINQAIACNSTANLDFSDSKKIKAVGNPTEGALLLWLNSQNIDYKQVRENVAILDRLPFTTENKYMATLTENNVLFLKGAPEIVLEFCSLTEDEKADCYRTLSGYQNKAMRTLALAYKKLDDGEKPFENGKLSANGFRLACVFGISDPVRDEVPAAVKECSEAGIQVKIVTGDTVNTAKEIGRQIGLFTEKDSDKNIITGTDFAALSDKELLDRVLDIKIIARARPSDKERFVKLLKAKDLVVAVTGDGTNDAPALNAADAGLSMGDGTAVAKEASDMTIQNNSFGTITNAVMWGRSLYKNIQRFIMFQMTINVVACLIVLIGAFTGTESPLTVTQMLWVNLIMDTFAAIALASLPPDVSVMKEKPRKMADSIISKPMFRHIFLTGGIFTALLLGILLIMQHADITAFTDLFTKSWGVYDGLSEYELSLFFTTFVFLQFWNMFNAKAFMTGKSAFHKIKTCKGFLTIAAVIFFGQIFIIEIGGKMFNVCHLHLIDWLWITGLSSAVMITGEIKKITGHKIP